MIVGIGVDVVHVPRIRRLLDDKGERAIERLFTPGEATYCGAKSDPARHFAARVAAKEAAFKALAGTDFARGIGWRDTEVITLGDGRPSIIFHGEARNRASELSVARIMVSLTHDGEVAVGMVVLEKE